MHTTDMHACGCHINETQWGTPRVVYCPMHAATPELLAALRDLAQLSEAYKIAAARGSPILMASIARARAAIEKATK